jgi:DNA-binding GntR family transcriptional regulator
MHTVTINADSRVPFHAQLAEILRDKIRRREITARVPSIVTLSQDYGVARNTAAHALRTLEEEGLITPVRGRGFYVTESG